MKTPRIILMSVILSVLASFLTVKILNVATPSSQAKESLYQRIMRTGVVHCTYQSWPPMHSADPTSGKVSGLIPEMLTKMGEQLNLKFEWGEQSDYAHVFEEIDSGRFDLSCALMAPTPARAKATDFTIPFIWAAMNAYVREGDARFDNNTDKLNAPTVTLGTLEGELSDQIAHEDFPKAKVHAITNYLDPGQVYQDLATGKVDAVIMEPMSANSFIKANPGKIRVVKGPPLRVQSVAFPIPKGEHELRRLFNHTIQNLIDTGYLEALIKKYPDADRAMLRAAPAYRATGQ